MMSLYKQFFFIGGVMACCLFVAGAPAQPPSGAEKPKDAQSAYEPKTAPGVGQKFLERFVGDWAVVKTIMPRSGGAPVITSGECHQQMIKNGRYLQSEFVFHEKDKTDTNGTGIVGFDPATGKFTSVWYDSRSVKMSFRQSADAFNGSEIILNAESIGGEPSKLQSRTVARLEDGGRKLIHRAYITLPDGKERLFMELALTRKPETKKP